MKSCMWKLVGNYLLTCKLQVSMQPHKGKPGHWRFIWGTLSQSSPLLFTDVYVGKCILSLWDWEHDEDSSPEKSSLSPAFANPLMLEYHTLPSLAPAWLLRSSCLHLFLSCVNKTIPNPGRFRLWKITAGWLILPRFSVKAPHVL